MIFCEGYVVCELTNCCSFFIGLGFEYTCLSKKVGLKQCPWVGKPWYSFTAVAKTDEVLKLPGEVVEHGSK